MSNKEKNKKEEIEHIKCIWGLICNLSSIDQERNNISLFDVIEQFNIPPELFAKQVKEDKPLVFPHQNEIILLWRRTLGVGIFDDEILADFKIKTIDPRGQIIEEKVSPLKFPKGIRNLRYRVILSGVVFTTEGDYIHQIELKLQNSNEFKKVIEIPFEIKSLDEKGMPV